VQRGADINGEAAGDLSGVAVSLSSDGSVVAIGARANDGAASNAGHVRVYEWNGSSWAQRGSDIDGLAAGDLSGFSVSLRGDGSLVAIGAINYDKPGQNNAGRVQIHAWDGTSWILGGSIDGEAAGDNFGYSVSLASDSTKLVVAVGAIYNDGAGVDAGHVRVFEWDGSTWAQRGSDHDGELTGDHLGRSVSLSAEGQYVAIGAPWNDGSFSKAGHVRVFGWNGTSWIQRGPDLDGEAADDNSGFAVSLSADASTVAVGSPDNDGAGALAGHVRVYRW
jgi:hypothetical protein